MASAHRHSSLTRHPARWGPRRARACTSMLLVTGQLALAGLGRAELASSRPAPTTAAPETTADAISPPTVLESAQAAYPLAAQREGREATVRLKVTIDQQGRVADVQVMEPAGHGFDEAAVEAMRRYRFSPATRAGEPVAVAIEFAMRFVLLPEADDATAPTSAPAAEMGVPEELHTLQGQVREKGTRAPLGGAEVHVVELDRTLEVDAQGRFRLRVPAGRYTLKVSAPDHQGATTKVPVTGLHLTSVEVFLPSKRDERYRTVVRTRRDDRAEEPVIRLSREEVRKIPGTFGDPVRVLQTLPGVARPRTLEGDIVVRGSEPGNTPLYLGGFPVPFLFHFGILQSVVDPAFIDRVDFYPGGVPLRYGNAAQGVVDVHTAEAKADRFSAEFDLGAVNSAGAATIPLLDGDLRLDAGGRYSYVGLTLPLLLAPATLAASEGELVVSVLPEFWDYNLRVSGGPPELRAYANFFGAHDGVTIDIILVEQLIQDLLGQRGRSEEELPPRLPVYDNTFHHFVSGLALRRPDGVEVDAALLLGLRKSLNVLTAAGPIGAGIMERDTRLAAARVEGRLPAHERLALRVGGEAQVRDEHLYPMDEIPALAEFMPSARDQPLSSGLFLALEGKPWPHGRVTAGARLQADTQNGEEYLRADPRVVLEHDAAYGITARVAYAHQTQIPDYVMTSPALGADPLPLTVSDQAMGGLRLDLPWELEAGVTAYVSRMGGLALAEPGWRPFVDEETGESGIEPYIRYVPAEGHAYGLELSLRRRPKGRFFGWVSYSVSRALRRTRDIAGFVGDYDQPHHLVAVAAYKLGWGVELSARFRLASGNPFTPMLGAFDADTLQYQEVRGPHNSARDPLYHQLDVRVDKTFTFDLFKIGAYLDVYNVYLAPNPLPISELHLYSYDHFNVSGVGSLPIMPFFGLHAEF